MLRKYTHIKQYEDEILKLKEEGYVPAPKGRPRVRPLTEEEELRKELERLQMENDLLRDFLSEIERK